MSENVSWWQAIENAILKTGQIGKTTGFRTFVGDIEYNNSNSNQDGMCYKACKMSLGIEERKDFVYNLKIN